MLRLVNYTVRITDCDSGTPIPASKDAGRPRRRTVRNESLRREQLVLNSCRLQWGEAFLGSGAMIQARGDHEVDGFGEGRHNVIGSGGAKSILDRVDVALMAPH